MCLGGGKNKTEEIYQSIKVDPEPLPSLSMESPKDRSGTQYRSIRPMKRTGVPQRSLVSPFGTGV